MIVFTCTSFAQSDDDKAEQATGLDNLAEIYVDQYFKPDEKFTLSEEGEGKAEALAHYSIGRMLENSGQPEAAVASYQRVLKIRPQELMLARKTANLLARTGQTDEARELLEEALKLNPKSPRAPVVLSEFLYTYFSDEEEDIKTSLKLATDAVEKFPDTPEVYENLVLRYLREGKPQEAKAVMDAASKRSNKNPYFWLRMGPLAKRTWPIRTTTKTEPLVVNKFYEKALEHGKNNLQVVEAVGDYYARSNQPAKAQKIFEEIVSKNPDLLNIRRKLVAIYEAQGEQEKMVSAMKGIVEIDPQDSQMSRKLANLYFQKVMIKQQSGQVLKSSDEDIYNTAKYYRKALQSGKGPAGEYIRAGQFFSWAKKYAEAIDILESGAYLYPDEPVFLVQIADALGRDDQWEKASQKYELAEKVAQEHNPDLLDKEFYFDFGVSFERSGDIDKASEYLRKSVELIANEDPDEAGDPKRRDEFTARVYNYLGYTWVENDRNIDEGGELIKTALELEPENGAYIDSLGWYKFKKKEYAEALELLLKSHDLMVKERKDLEDQGYELSPMDGVTYDHIGQAYWNLGEKEKAIDYLEKAVAAEIERKAEYEARLKKYRETEPPVAKPAEDAPKPADKPADPAEPGEADDSPKGASKLKEAA